MYKRVIKRFLDIILSGVAIAILAFPMLIVAIAIKIDDPGPVLFKQKRIGIKKDGNSTHFMILKFRSMRMTAPSEVPTHLLNNPDQHITRIGKFIRKTSIDELPQILQVFTGKLSWVGPRPVLWSETDLLEEREKYGANDVKPGITGWAQINGRDILDAPTKARFDGEYAAALNSGFFKGFWMDVRCFFGTIGYVLKSEGVVEGNTSCEANDQQATQEELVTK